MKHINCKALAQELLDEVKAAPTNKKLVIFTAGDNPASASYVKGKIKDCEYCGVPYEHITVQAPFELETLIRRQIFADDTGGIIIQLPLPEGWDEEHFTNLVPPRLDVDGFVPDSRFKPCTPEGIMYLLKKELGELSGKTALVIGRGKLVGEPVAKMLLDEDCTVTVAHSKTRSLDDLLAEYHDIVITAVGRPFLVDLLNTNAKIVIDAGIAKDGNGKLRGDCFFFSEDVAPNMKVTPVPGGIGLLTRAMLMQHMKEV